MKIQDYNSMMSYLTRPGTKTEKKIEVSPKQQTLPGLSPKELEKTEKKKDVFDKLGDDLVKNYNLYDVEPEPKKAKPKDDPLRKLLIEKMQTKELDSDEIRYLMDTKDRSSLSTQKISNTEQRILGKGNKSNTNTTPLEQYNEITKPKQATPEQYGKLAEKLERQRQMSGKTAKPFTKKIKQSYPPIEIPRLDVTKIENKIERDPKDIELEKKFNEILRQSEEEKIKNASTGLAGLINPGAKRNV